MAKSEEGGKNKSRCRPSQRYESNTVTFNELSTARTFCDCPMPQEEAMDGMEVGHTQETPAGPVRIGRTGVNLGPSVSNHAKILTRLTG
jgi:hypothetical protein